MKFLFIISFIIQLLLINAASINNVKVTNDDSTDYLITVPKVLTNEQDKICLVWLNEQTRPSSENFEVKIKEIGLETLVEKVSAPLTSETTCVEIPTKKIRSQRAELEISIGKKVYEKHEVQVRSSVNLVLIETSKPIYHPSEIIKFNIWTVDQLLKPATESFKKIWVENPYGIPMKQWADVISKDGVLSFKIKTAEENIFGRWTIKALTKDNHLIVKVFELTRYLDPKINIDVVKPNYLLSSEKETEVEIKTTDQFRYPIKGQIKVTVGYKPTPFDDPREVIAENMPVQKFDQKIEELTKITLNHTLLQADSIHNAQRYLLIKIEVEQEKTNLTQTLIQELPISQKKVLITLPSSRMGKQYFKPNLPFRSYFSVEKPDLSEAENEKMTVCYEMRKKSWIQQSEDRKCKEYTSTKRGIVEFETEPIKKETEQLLITVYPTQEPNLKNSFVVQPWFTNSYVNFLVKPTIRRERCLMKHSIEMTLFNVTEKMDAFYQVIGRQTEKPVKFVIDPTKLTKINDKLSKMNIEIESNLLSAIYSPIARVVVFLRDLNQTLVADYDTFEVTCEDKFNEIQVSAHPKKESEYEFDVNIKSSDDSRCVLQVSQQPYRHQLIQKRIARLMEKMDVNLDFMYHDKCEKQLFINQKKNNNLRNVVPQESIVNFQSSWDVFNKVGLSAISNKDLDQSPCELELYPEGFSQEMINNFEETKFNLLVQRNYYNNDLVELKKLEQNITEDLIQWINFRKPNEKIVVRNDQIGEEGELHFNAICLSPKSGLQFGHKKLAQNAVQPFKVDIIVPNQVVVDEVVYIYVDLHKENTETYPVIVEPVENPNYKLVLESGQKNHFDFSGEHYRIIYVLKAIKPGQTIVKFIVKDGQNGSKYPAKVHTHHFTIVKFGSFVRNTEYQILVNPQNSPKTFELLDNTNQKVRNLSISTDILDILIPKDQNFQKRSQSSRDGFSLQYKSPLELVSYLTILSENEKHIQDEKQRELLRMEIERIYQILETKRLPDGSYSAFIGKSAAVPFVDAALTSTIFKLYIQLKQNYLPQISPIAMKQTFLFLNKLQLEDGSFKTPVQPIKAFPMNLNKSLDVTSYIVMQFAEAKSDFSSPFMRKSLHFIIQKLNSTKDEKEDILPKSIVAYLYSLRKNNEKAEKWLSKVDMKNLNEVARKENGEQIIAINLLTAINLNKKTEIERLAMFLLNKQQEINQDQLFSSPLVSQAIVRAWDVLNGKDQTVKVNGKTVTRNPLRLNENKIVLESKSFIIATFKKEQLRTNENQKDFKVTVNGLKRGFKSCAQRSINICYKSKNDKKVIRNPVLNVQIPTGFIVDEWLLSNMLTYGSSSQLDSFDIRQQNLHLLLKPIVDNKSSCIEIPIVQVQRVDNRQKYSVQMVNYYDYQKELSQKQISQFDTIFFELPKECEVIDRALFTLGLRELKKTPQFRQGEEIFDQHHSPLEILNCPDNIDDSCPRCLDETNKSNEKEICENKFSSLVHRRDLKTEERTLFNKTKNQKRCVVLPMKIHHIISSKNEKLEDKEDVLVYINEKCRCNYINEKQGHGKAILIKKNINEITRNQALQLTKEDTLIVYSGYQNGEEPTCLKKLINNKRSKRNTEEEKKEMIPEADKEDKNKRSYGYEAPKPMPKPAYPQPSYGQGYNPAPAYEVPKPSYAPQPSYQSYESPSMSYESQYQSGYENSYEAPSSYGYEMPPASYNYEAPKHAMPYETPSYNYGYSKPSYQPMYKAPKPSYAPQPMYQPPKPMYEAPKPSYGQPPMYEAPKPSYAPQPMYEAPKPTYGQPPMYEAPKPSYGQPPMYEAPKPSYAPQPMYEAPKPSYGQPPMYEAPKPTYGQPPMYEAPKPSYAPQPMYEAPKPTYGQPPMYEAPKPSYAPQPMYEAPKPNYAPQPMYEAPKPNYAPQPMYEAPKPSYGQPPMYEAPKPSYGQPSMYEAPKPSYGQPPMYEAPSYGQSYGPSSYYESSPMSYESPNYGYEAPSYGYEAPSMSYEAPSPSYGYDYPSKSYSSYKRSVYGMSSPASSPATQPEYNQPQYNAHTSNPGYLTAGYMQSQSYGQQGNYEINLDYYTNQLNNHNKNGAHYKPAPIIIAPIYEPTAYQQKPYQPVSYQPTTYKPASYSSYKRNAAFDLASSASNAYQSYGEVSYGTESYAAPAQSSYSSTSSYTQPQMSYGSTQSYSAPAQSSYSSASSYPTTMSYAAPAQQSSYAQQLSYAAPAQPSYSSTSSYPATMSSYAAPAQQASYAAPAPQMSYAAPAPQTSYAAPAPQASYAAPAQQMSYAAPAQQMSYAAPAQQMSYAAPAQQMSYAAPAQQMSYAAPAQQAYQQPAQPSYQSSYANQQTYAVLYTPVKYATAYVPTYVQASYSSGYGAVPAYGAASEQKSIVSKVPAKCDKPAKTCPVCEDIASLELLNNICKLDLITTVYKANQTLSARDQAVCGKMNVIENIMKTKDDKEYNFNINENCECPQLRKSNVFANAIVLAPKNKINGRKVQLDENVYVLNDSINMRHEIYNMAKQCNKDNLEDF